MNLIESLTVEDYDYEFRNLDMSVKFHFEYLPSYPLKLKVVSNLSKVYNDKSDEFVFEENATGTQNYEQNYQVAG